MNNPFSPITDEQKLKLYDLHSRYMVNEYTSYQNWDAKQSGENLSAFVRFYESLGLTMREAEIISWEVCKNYDEIRRAA